MRRAVAGCVGLSLWALACDTAPPPMPTAIPTPTPFVLNTNCRGELSELGPLPFPTEKAACESFEYFEERHCPGAYIAFTRAQKMLPIGSTKYYDGDRRLFAYFAFSDFGQTYCNGTSFNKTWGTLPARCPVPEVVTNMCR